MNHLEALPDAERKKVWLAAGKELWGKSVAVGKLSEEEILAALAHFKVPAPKRPSIWDRLDEDKFSLSPPSDDV